MFFYLAVGIAILVVGIILAKRLIINGSFVSAYNKGEYRADQEQELLDFNFPEGYIPYYNLGNAAYKQGDYNSAVSYYTEALKQYPPEKRECDIRVNLALALCNTIDFYNLDSQEKIDTALFILYKARDVLLEKGCATDEGEPGHDEDAQQLKEDIDKMIEKLKNPDQGNDSNEQKDNNNGGNSEGDNNNDSKSGDKEKKIQNELEENQKGALEDRKDQQDNLEKWGSYIPGEDGKEGGAGAASDYNPW